MQSNKQRTSDDLRTILFDELDKLRSGESTPARAKAAAQLAQTILASAMAEAAISKHIAGGAHFGTLTLTHNKKA